LARPETKYTPAGKLVASFSLAVNRRRGEDESTNWYRCSCFGRLAETVDKLAQQGAMVKGREVCVTGNFEPASIKPTTAAPDGLLMLRATTCSCLGARDTVEQPKVGDYDDLPF
jgi:hypothetical protein